MPRIGELNINTFLLALVVSLAGWNLYQTHKNTVELTSLSATMHADTTTHEANTRELLELRARITAVEIQLASLSASYQAR